MNIGIDARILKTGIGTYTFALVNEIRKLLGTNDHLYIFLRAQDSTKFSFNDSRVTKVIADYKSYSFAEQLFYPLLLSKYKLDLMHFTTFNVPILWWKKYVVTIHDLIHLKHSTFGNITSNYLYYLLKKLIYIFVIKFVSIRARIVITDSEATKSDLINVLHINNNKIEVVYLAGNYDGKYSDIYETENKLAQQFQVDGQYILYASTMYSHKNHKRLIAAFRKVLDQRPGVKLVLVGKVDKMSEKVKDFVKNLGLENDVLFPNYKVSNGYISVVELQNLYKNATMFAYPSLQEGFGIPVLEAQEYGIPVAASNIDCLKEIGNDSVLYFDPMDVDSIVEVMHRLLDDNTLRQELIKKGYINAVRFSWKLLAEKTLLIYKKVIND